MNERVHLFGIRHHGPGSAASLLRSLEALQPKVVLIEGPSDASELIPFVIKRGMRPPLAILQHGKKNSQYARFFPFAEFSPEWQAMHWAVTHKRPVLFIDLPMEKQPVVSTSEAAESEAEAEAEQKDEQYEQAQALRRDPLGHLANLAGYSDSEAWWNELVEQSVHSTDVFGVIAEAMTALREHVDQQWQAQMQNEAPEPAELELWQREQRREAYMRLQIKEALKAHDDGDIAVVCGALHVPALQQSVPLKDDKAVLKGFKAEPTEACWIPWTDQRLCVASGYRAGIASPGWYRYLWRQFQSQKRNDAQQTNASEKLSTHLSDWHARVAMLLRAEGLLAATSSVIDAVRLSHALSAVRNLAQPGLNEVMDASLSTLCYGEKSLLRLIEEKLVIGTEVGRVDKSAPQHPLAADVARLQKKLRLKPEAFASSISLDLRSNAGMAKSTLLHRLRLLDIHWGKQQDGGHSRGTFRETWVIEWQPELSVRLAEASVYGPTVEQAAAECAVERARLATSVEKLSDLLRGCLLSNLPDAMRSVIQQLQEAAVNTTDIKALMLAVPPLADVLRYGTARTLPTAELNLLVRQMTVEVIAGARMACHQLDYESALSMRSAITEFHQSLVRAAQEHTLHHWKRTLLSIADDDHATPLIRGQATRILHDLGVDEETSPYTTAQRLSLALSPAVKVEEAGQWIEGFIDQSGDVFLHDDALFALVDAWLSSLSAEHFIEILPVLRRSFSSFDAGMRVRMLDAVAASTSGGALSSGVEYQTRELNTAFTQVLPTVLTMLGLDSQDGDKS